MALIVKRSGNLFPTLTNSLFDTGRLFGPSLIDLDEELDGLESSSTIVPEANVIEDEKQFTIELAAPGLDKKDFKIEIDSNVLTVSAEQKKEEETAEQNYHMREFSFRSFSRSFLLPEQAMHENTDAKYENGILTLSIPKKELKVEKAVKQILVG